MILNFDSILELFFPSSDDEKCLASCSGETFYKKYRPKRTGDIITLLPFSDDAVRAAIHLNKFHHHKRAQTLLGETLCRWLIENKAKHYLIVPIPLSSRRLRKRGYNQVSEVINVARLQCPTIEYDDSIFGKGIDTKPQTSLKREERVQNMQGAYHVHEHKKTLLRDRHILLIDDVSTTGATLREAKATLLPHEPASITCLALAH